jgi:DNA-binding NarL/FixJ family response regulator
LIEAIRRAASGENLFNEQQKKRARKWHEEVEKKWSSLSERERQVLRLLADGLSNKDIASKLSITIKTLDKHLEKIYQKLRTDRKITFPIRAVFRGKMPLKQKSYFSAKPKLSG